MKARLCVVLSGRLGSAVAVLLMFAAAPARAAATPGAYLGDLSWPEAEALPVVVAPPIAHGWLPAFRAFPGTEVADPAVFIRYVDSVARSLIRAGARRIVFLNTSISKAGGLPLSIAESGV